MVRQQYPLNSLKIQILDFILSFSFYVIEHYYYYFLKPNIFFNAEHKIDQIQKLNEANYFRSLDLE